MPNLLYAHGGNLQGKIDNNYKGLQSELIAWQRDHYLPWRDRSEEIAVGELLRAQVDDLTDEMERYLLDLRTFVSTGAGQPITSQSGFESTVLEEFCSLLFTTLPAVANDPSLECANKKVFMGMFVKANGEVKFTTKDSDFCIARRVEAAVGEEERELLVPILTIECKTSYVDKTMLSSLMESARTAKQGTLGVRCYVLAETKQFDMSLHNSAIDEVFVLKRHKEDPFCRRTVWEFYEELRLVLQGVDTQQAVTTPGRLVQPGFMHSEA
jgi:hypothetical protein